MADNKEILKKTNLFKNITDFEFNNIINEINIYEKKYAERAIVLMQGEPYNDLNIIIDGECNGEMVDYSGKIIKIEEFRSPYVLASGILFSGNNLMPVSVTSKTKVKILIIRKIDILKLCSISKNFLKNFLIDISDKLVLISQKISFLAFKTIKEKIANYLFALTPDNSGIIKLATSLEELANLFGVSRPSLSRVLMQLEKGRIISRKNKMIKIIDREKLLSD